MPTVETAYGLLEVSLEPTVDDRHGRPWRAVLVDRHPLLRAITSATGATEQDALDNLVAGVHRFGGTWPAPMRLGRVEEDDVATPYTPAKVVERVLVDVDGEDVDAWAVGWRGELVFVRWHEERDHRTTAWVEASSVRRQEAAATVDT